jgi:hypothetical protein
MHTCVHMGLGLGLDYGMERTVYGIRRLWCEPESSSIRGGAGEVQQFWLDWREECWLCRACGWRIESVILLAVHMPKGLGRSEFEA